MKNSVIFYIFGTGFWAGYVHAEYKSPYIIPMSFAADTLALAQAAYQKALAGQAVEFNGRRFTAQNIDALFQHVKYWQGEVDREAALAAGRSYRGPVRFTL